MPPHMASRMKASAAPPHRDLRLGRDDVPGDAAQGEPWDNKAVRQAVAYAIDREAIIQGVLRARAGSARALSRGQYAYDPDLAEGLPYDPERPGSCSRRPATRTAWTWSSSRRSAATCRTSRSRRRWPRCSARRHSRRAEDARVADDVGQRAEGQGAVLLHGPRAHDQRRTGALPIFRDRASHPASATRTRRSMICFVSRGRRSIRRRTSRRSIAR